MVLLLNAVEIDSLLAYF